MSVSPSPLTPPWRPRRDLEEDEEDPYFTDGFPENGFGMAKKPPGGGSIPPGKGHVSEVVSR